MLSRMLTGYPRGGVFYAWLPIHGNINVKQQNMAHGQEAQDRDLTSHYYYWSKAGAKYTRSCRIRYTVIEDVLSDIIFFNFA